MDGLSSRSVASRTSGKLFRVEVDGEPQLTRMEYDEGYYSIDGYPLRDGLRAAIGAEG